MVDQAAYQEQAEASIVRRRVETHVQMEGLLAAMCFSEKWGGRALYLNFPELALTRGMRLMEVGPVTDVAELGHLEFPCDLTFF